MIIYNRSIDIILSLNAIHDLSLDYFPKIQENREQQPEFF